MKQIDNATKFCNQLICIQPSARATIKDASFKLHSSTKLFFLKLEWIGIMSTWLHSSWVSLQLKMRRHSILIMLNLSCRTFTTYSAGDLLRSLYAFTSWSPIKKFAKTLSSRACMKQSFPFRIKRCLSDMKGSIPSMLNKTLNFM